MVSNMWRGPDAGMNPFSSAAGGATSAPMGGRPPLPAAVNPFASTGGGGMPSSRFASSPALASDGPLAKAGWIGSLLTAGNPSIAGQQAERAGGANTAILTKLSQAVQSGMPIQRALMDVFSSPEGKEFFAAGGDINDLVNSAKAIAPDQNAAIRSQVFGGMGGAAGASGPAAASGEPRLAMGDYIEAAAELAAAGDDEGARIAMSMAEESRMRDQMTTSMNTDDINEYNFYVAQEMAAGRQPTSFMDFLVTGKKAGVADVPFDPAFTKAAMDAYDSADMSEQLEQEIRTFQQMAQGVETGAVQAWTLPIQQAFASIGIEVNPNLDALQQLAAMQNQFALRLRNPKSEMGLTGNTSDRDVSFLKQATLGVDKTPNANEMMGIVFGAKFRRQALMERAKADYIMENQTIKGWSEARKALGDATPFFTKQEEQRLNEIRQENGLPAITDAEISEDLNNAGTSPSGRAANKTGRVKDFSTMSVDDLYKLDPTTMSEQELKAADKRMKALQGGQNAR